MTTSKSHNGYKNYSQWNQSLWINNDEGLYDLALECIASTENRNDAVDSFLACMSCLADRTPDGVKWSKAGIRAAMVGIEK